MRLTLVGAVVACVTLIACGAPDDQRTPVTLIATSSLATPLEELAALHELRAGQRVRLHFGASGTLARQIADGAPADLFISADPGAGATDAAVVFASDARQVPARRVIEAVPQGATEPISYVGAVTTRTPVRSAAVLLLDLVAGLEGQHVLRDAGFAPPTAPRP